MNKFCVALLSLFLALLLSACSALFYNDYRSGSSSSLVEFLYPGGEIPPPIKEQIPEIKVPARVGLAFVPSRQGMQLGEGQQAQLLMKVRDAFVGRDYVERIEIIPSTYLTGVKGFDALEQVGRLYNVDLMALVSHDQVLSTGDTASSFLYWTIVGAYVIKGSSNDVTTFVDTAVFDLNTRRMLFRAPGLDEGTKRSTAVGVGEVKQELSEVSFAAAVDKMTVNLDSELERFRERIKQDQSVRIVNRNDSGGQGSADLLFLCFCLLACLVMGRSGLK